MQRRWVVIVVALLAVLVIAPIVLLALAGPVEAPTIDASAPPASTSIRSEGAIPFANAVSPEEAAWYRVGGDPREFPPHIQVGTMADGVTFDLPMRWDPNVAPEAIVPMRPVLGVGGGVVVIVDDDGGRSLVRAVVAATGDVHDLLVSNDVVVNGVLDVDGRVAYYVTANRLTGDLTGAWRLSVGDGRVPDAIDPLLAAEPDMRAVAITRFFSRMLLSPDGTTLGLFRCLEVDCALRAVRTADGSLVGEVRIPRGGGDPFAITGTSALLRPIVPDGPHRIGEIADLASGESTAMPFEGWPGTEAVVEGRNGPVLALQTAGFTAPPEAVGEQLVPPQVTVFSVADMQALGAYEPPLSSLVIFSQDDYSVGVDLPSGWILILGSQPGDFKTGAYALNVDDGSMVPLPALGEFFRG